MRILLSLFAFLFVVSAAQAQDELGLGIIIGEPTGLSAKQWISRTEAIDAALAWSFLNDTKIQLHADYLRHRVYQMEADDFDGRIPIYYGLGARVVLGNDATIGIRFPVGVGHTFSDYPVELFFEIVPVLDIVPKSSFDINAAIGARYYFKR